MIPPAFITFEGLDGTGKSTQLELLASHLRARGLQVETTREPGGTKLGERIRDWLLAGSAAPVPAAELALMTAARAQHVAERIQPALASGAWVLCDRYYDATVAYQGGGRGLDLDTIARLHQLLCAGLMPDLTMILTLDRATALARARRLPSAGRFEAEHDAFFARVEAAYRALAAREPARCRLVEAVGDREAVARRILALVGARWEGIV
ncbi:MAG: dTMP kinase [Terriglobales bacterium]